MSVEVCGPNVAMVKTGMCTGGKQIIVGGCTCFWPCCQELHRMELAVMTVVVHSSNVVTAEGVEITVPLPFSPPFSAAAAAGLVPGPDLGRGIGGIAHRKFLLTPKDGRQVRSGGGGGKASIRRHGRLGAGRSINFVPRAIKKLCNAP